MLQRRQRSRLPVAHQPIHRRQELSAHRRLRPWFVTTDEAPPLEALHLRTIVNGELRQEMRADDLIFTIPDLLAYVSQAVALQPGDVIVTGSPAGNGAIQRRWLRAGDRVEVVIDGIGPSLNHVAAEPEHI